MDKKNLLSKDVKPRKGEMIKPKEIIGIKGIEAWSLADRRTWDLLLVNAWGDKLEDPTADFTIELRELRGLHNGNDRVKACLEKLQKTLVTVEMPDGAVRTVQMLGGTDFYDSDREEGRLKYDFHRKLVPVLRKSEVYARMEVKVLSSFTSKYAIGLYEVLATKVNLRHKSTDEIDIETLRQWLGVEDGKLPSWSDLRRNAVEIAEKEVNGLSPFSVKIEPIRRGRKVIKVRISWFKKEPFSPAEQAAAREVNLTRTGRKARLSGTVEAVVPELSPEAIQKGYNAAASICRIDKDRAYHDWQTYVGGLPESPRNPTGHFIDFCKKRAEEIK